MSPGRGLPLAATCLWILGLACAGPSAHEPSPAAIWLRDYLRIDTTARSGNGAVAVDYLAALLDGTGAQVEVLDAGDGLPSLWALLPPSSPTAGSETLLLLHHLDVVDADGLWQLPPFAGEILDGELWGRGAIDSKGLGISHLAAFLALAHSGVGREHAVALLASAEEERGGGLGVGRWIDERPDLFADVTTVINEGGINRGYDGRLHWWGIEVTQKRPLWLVAQGAPADLIAGLRRLADRRYEWRVPPVAEFTFRHLAPLYKKRWRTIFLDLDRFVLPTGPTVMLMPGMETFFLDSIQTNSLEILDDGRAAARIDIRLLPDSDQEVLLAEVRSLLGSSVETSVLLSSPTVEPSPWESRWIDVLRRELSSVAPVVPQMAAGTTDSRYFRQHGIAAYGFSPFILNSEITRTVHGRNERIPLAEFDHGVERMTRVVTAWARGRGEVAQGSDGEAGGDPSADAMR